MHKFPKRHAKPTNPFETAVAEEAKYPLPMDPLPLGKKVSTISSNLPVFNVRHSNKKDVIAFQQNNLDITFAAQQSTTPTNFHKLFCLVSLPLPKFATRPSNFTRPFCSIHPHPAARLPPSALEASMLPDHINTRNYSDEHLTETTETPTVCPHSSGYKASKESQSDAQQVNPDSEEIQLETTETPTVCPHSSGYKASKMSQAYSHRSEPLRPFQWSRGLIQLPQPILRCPNADRIPLLPPVPTPPIDSPAYHRAMDRIKDHIHMFPISHSVLIDAFISKLKSLNFPNTPLLTSLQYSFHHGFWAGTGENLDSFTPDPLITPNDDNSPEFEAELEKLIAKELAAGYITQVDSMPPYSANVPLFAVFQKTKYRLIRNASKPRGQSINDFIPDDHRQTSYDYVTDLIPWIKLLKAHCPPGYRVVVWKGDIRSAFRTQPFHPLLQSRQFIITNDGRIFVDHRSIFGNGAGPHLLTSWSSTIAWYLRTVLPPIHIPSIGDFLHPILIYMDDFYSVCFQLESQFLNGAPPRPMLLTDQALRPYGIIMEPKKYEHGEFVVVTGFGVNTAEASLCLSESQTNYTLSMLDDLIHLEHTAIPFKRFEQATGVLNWASNVYFLIRPSLTPIYAAMKQVPTSARKKYRLTVSPLIAQSLRWLREYITNAPPVRLLLSEAWLPTEADFFLYTDACLSGMAFFLPDVNLLVYHLRPEGYRDHNNQQLPINTIELYCQFWARKSIPDILHLPSFGSRCLAYVDNTTACSNLNTFKSNNLIQSIIIREAALVELKSNISFLTHHVPGKINIIADLGSRGQINEIRRMAPHISCFHMPWLPPLPPPFNVF